MSALCPRTAKLSVTSSAFDLGNVLDYPVLTIAIPVKTTAVAGQTAPLILDPNFSQWLDPTGQNYPVTLSACAGPFTGPFAGHRGRAILLVGV